MPYFIRKSIICISTVLLILASEASAEPLPPVLTVDYADYNPLSLVIKKFGWLEQEFKTAKVHVHWLRWVFTPGDDLALKYLQTDSLNIASTSSLASVWSRAGGNPIKVVYVFARPEWETIVVPRDSPIQSVKDLKGKKVAAAVGTGPYFFLLRALRDAGMHKEDVEIVPLPHSVAISAVELKSVDAWAGVNPYAAMSQLERGARVIYRNPVFNSYGVLNTSEAFAKKYPQEVTRVIKAYERARIWALKHPEDLEVIFAEEARVSYSVARLVLSRFDFSNPVIDRNDIRVLKDAAPVLKEEKLIPQDTDLDKVIDDLIDPGFVIKQVGAGLGR